MKYVLIIPDGVADEPQASLGGYTPLQAARIPHMDRVAAMGVGGRTDNVPQALPSGSDVGTMSLFGYDPMRYHTGRAPLEAAAQGLILDTHDWAVRCNLVTVENGVMRSFTADQYPTEKAAEIIALLQRDVGAESAWHFHPGVSYRNLLIYRNPTADAPFGPETKTTPPHDITGQPVAAHLPAGPGADTLTRLMDRSAALFADAEPNQQRRQAGEAAATQVWLWGQGSRPALAPFRELFGVRGAVITAVDLLRGLGRLIGWDVVEVDGATGYLDTNYAGKGQAAIDLLKADKADFVVVHVEATDEASHEGDAEAKVRALEQIDEHIVGPVHEYLAARGNYRLLICPDHPTFLRTKTHSHGDCPFALCGAGVTADAVTSYDEAAVMASDLRFDAGHRLMPFLFQSSAD